MYINPLKELAKVAIKRGMAYKTTIEA